MKLNYRDKVVLGILLAIVILVASFVGLVKPKMDAIKADKLVLAQKEEERDQVQSKIDSIVPLTNDINDIYAETKKLTSDFVSYDKILRTSDIDQYMQEYADENSVMITKLDLTELAEGAANYYYFTPTYVGESMLEASDLNGNVMQSVEEDKAESTSLNERTVEQSLLARYAVSIIGKKEGVWSFMKAIEDQDETVLIDSVRIADYTFGELKDENGNTIQEAGEGESAVDMVISLYSVYEMQKPNTDAD